MRTSYLVLTLNQALNIYAALDSTSDGFYFIIVNNFWISFPEKSYVKLLIIDLRSNLFKF